MSGPRVFQATLVLLTKPGDRVVGGYLVFDRVDSSDNVLLVARLSHFKSRDGIRITNISSEKLTFDYGGDKKPHEVAALIRKQAGAEKRGQNQHQAGKHSLRLSPTPRIP